MEIGVHLPEVGPLANRDSLSAFARHVEAAGLDSLWVSDHVLIPRRIQSRYPYSRDGSFPLPPDTPFLEPVATLLFVAALTERVKLGTTVLVIPMRNPVVHAKLLASLDVLSSGRLVLGVGAGWMREEFDLLHVPFEKRGARTSEYIELYKELWTKDNPSFKGRFWEIEEVGFAPKPLQMPHPPIWVGGHSAPALERAGRHGDAWHAIGLPPERLAPQYQQVRRHAEEAGRDPQTVGLTIRTRLPLDDPSKATDQLAGFAEIGASHAVLEITTADLDRARSMIDTLAREVRPKVA